ncbi:MAG: metallophosphoesterase family protein [Christensenellales bacterium]|jgi:predicted phosphodiesterase
MKKILCSKPCVFLIAVLAVLAPVLNYSFRIAHVFVNAMTFAYLSDILLIVMVANAIFMLIYAYRLARNLTGTTPRAYYAALPLTFLFLVIICVYCIMSPPDIAVMFDFLIDMLPYLAIVFGALFLMFVYPYLKYGIQKAVCVALIIGIAAAIAIPAFGLYPFAFDSDPLVLDNGEEYIIVWATNDESSGWVEYTYDNKEYKLYHQNGGRIVSGKIHNVKVPYAHLNNNTYSVHSTRVIDELSYGGRMGKTISSKAYNFRGELPENANIWALTDWHCEIGAVLKATSYLDRPDAVLMLGDYANGYSFEKDVTENIIAAGAKVTKGECPAIFALGNHDTRGPGVTHLGYLLGIENFYFQVDKGAFSFLILNSGEDKEDNHPEYGGLTSSYSYSLEQLEWLGSLEPLPRRYAIALSHDTEFNFRDTLKEEYRLEAERLNVQLVIGGHIHKAELASEDYPVLFAGGKQGEKIWGNLTYTATQLTFDNGSAQIKSVNEKGAVVLQEQFSFEP